MKCPVCKTKTQITNTREKGNLIRRHRECDGCLTTFTTSEKVNYNELDPYILKQLHVVVEGKS